MFEFNAKIAQIMNQKQDAKTIVFTTKMFGYGARIVFEKIIKYPFEIQIPLDSRLTRIYFHENK